MALDFGEPSDGEAIALTMGDLLSNLVGDGWI